MGTRVQGHNRTGAGILPVRASWSWLPRSIRLAPVGFRPRLTIRTQLSHPHHPSGGSFPNLRRLVGSDRIGSGVADVKRISGASSDVRNIRVSPSYSSVAPFALEHLKHPPDRPKVEWHQGVGMKVFSASLPHWLFQNVHLGHVQRSREPWNVSSIRSDQSCADIASPRQRGARLSVCAVLHAACFMISPTMVNASAMAVRRQRMAVPMHHYGAGPLVSSFG